MAESRIESARERYTNDPAYHAVVTSLYKAIAELHLTPMEVRDAAMLAAIMFYERHPSPPMFRGADR